MTAPDIRLKADAATVAEIVYQLTKTRSFLIEAFNEAATPAEKTRMSDYTRKIDHTRLKLKRSMPQDKREETAAEMFNALIQRAELLNVAIIRHDKRFERDLAPLMASLGKDNPQLGNPEIAAALEEAGAPLLARNFRKSLG